MEILKESWHAKVYMNWYLSKHREQREAAVERIKYYSEDAEFYKHELENFDKENKIHNLCPYVRIVLLWSWMRYGFLNKRWQVRTYTWIVFSLVLQLAIFLVGGTHALKGIWEVIGLFIFSCGAFAAAAGIIILIGKGLKRTSLQNQSHLLHQ